MDDLSSLVASTPLVVVEDGQASSSSSCLDLASQAPSANLIVFTGRSTIAPVVAGADTGEREVEPCAPPQNARLQAR